MTNYAEEQLHHHAHHHADAVTWARMAAVVIAALAGALAIVELGSRDAQTGYLARNIAAADLWNEYQAKSVRRVQYGDTADILEALGDPAKQAVADRIHAARDNAARMASEPGKSGMEQIMAHAREEEAERDRDQRRYEGLELSGGGLQLAIVLASAAVVTSMLPMLIGAGVLGVVSVLWAGAVWLGQG